MKMSEEAGADGAKVVEPEERPEKEQPATCQELLEAETARSREFEGRFRRALADYTNLERRAAQSIQDGIDRQTDAIFRDFLDLYDDFGRARQAYREQGTDTTGLDSVFKNAEALLNRHGISPIQSVGKAFDPQRHEAMATVVNPDLEEHTVTRELRKGYITSNRIIRPALVEISTRRGETT